MQKGFQLSTRLPGRIHHDLDNANAEKWLWCYCVLVNRWTRGNGSGSGITLRGRHQYNRRDTYPFRSFIFRSFLWLVFPCLVTTAQWKCFLVVRNRWWTTSFLKIETVVCLKGRNIAVLLLRVLWKSSWGRSIFCYLTAAIISQRGLLLFIPLCIIDFLKPVCVPPHFRARWQYSVWSPRSLIS